MNLFLYIGLFLTIEPQYIPVFGSFVLNMLIFAANVIIVPKVRQLFNSVKLAEIKHEATIYAMNRNYGNGFYDDYTTKKEELIRDNKFKIKGE